MLSRLVLVSALGLALVASAVDGIEAADKTIVCPPVAGPCEVKVTDPGDGDSGDDGRGGLRKPCVGMDGHEVPCHDPVFGDWNPKDKCYYRLVEPQPPVSNPVWKGHRPPDGAIYETTCPGVVGTGGGWVWLPAAPGGPSPEELAQEAVRRLPIRGPEIGMAPAPGTSGLVGLPVWLWTSVSPSTWGPATATASVPGLSVTATARAVRIVWEMGDGHSVACSGPGTPYRAAYEGRMSPTCGYRYVLSSARQPGGTYRITATTTWDVTWVGGGQTGQLSVERASQSSARIGEMQVLIGR